MSAVARRRALPPWPARRPLRAWQQRAVDALAAHDGEAFLASATPAAGKTTFGLRVAYELLQAGRVQRVTILAPTAHIARQWAADAARYGIDLEPNRPNAEGPEPPDRHGVAVTYQAVAAGPRPHRNACARRPTLLIADEPHHMGEDATWGTTTMDAFARAELRLLLSGTPFRSDNSPIPWVEYDADGFSSADYTYTYTDALLDGVCRPITFVPYDGDMEWVSDGRRRHADFSLVLPRAEDARRLRTALDAGGDWVRRVLRDADARLAEIRAGEHPDAGGLVVAIDKQHAVDLAARLEAISGEPVMIVTSDEPDASQRIARFAAGTQRWIVSVLMVSEGVDIPRLRVGVYATTARTELFFRQVVGRFIRRSPAPRRQMSFLFLPSDLTLKVLAGRIEEERNHAIELRPAVEDGELDEPPERVQSEPGAMFEALSSDARPDEAIHLRTQPGENLSLFGDPEPARSAAYMAFTGGAAADGDGTRSNGEGTRSRPRRAIRPPPTSGASGCARSAAGSSRSARGRPARVIARSTRASTAPSVCERSPTRRSTSWRRRTSCCVASWRAGGEADPARPAAGCRGGRCYPRERGPNVSLTSETPMAVTSPPAAAVEGLCPAELDAWRGLLRVHASVLKALDAELEAAHGLPLTSYEVLIQLADAPERKMRMCDLADSVLLSRSGMSRLVDRLERDGLLCRAACTNDARGAFACITQAGIDLLDQARPTHVAGIRRRFLAQFEEDELRLLGLFWDRLVPPSA